MNNNQHKRIKSTQITLQIAIVINYFIIIIIFYNYRKM